MKRAPTQEQLRIFALLCVLYAALTAAVVPWADAPGPADARIVVVYGIGIAVADLCTALLLGALYRGSGRRVLLVLACAYLFGGAMAAAHMATFPGALFAMPLFGGGQTMAWLYLAWRFGFAALVFAAVAPLVTLGFSRGLWELPGLVWGLLVASVAGAYVGAYAWFYRNESRSLARACGFAAALRLPSYSASTADT